MTTSTITTSDGTQLFYQDQGLGVPVIFSHDWPLNSDFWDLQRDVLVTCGYRAIAHDRRGHGRSARTSGSNNADTYAADLADLIATLDLANIVLVGHGVGGGEVARYVTRHGPDRVTKVVLVGSVTPLMLRTEANPHGTPIEVFDRMREGVAADRSQFYMDFGGMFYGANRPSFNVSRGDQGAFWSQAMEGSLESQLDCIRVFSETDFTRDLERLELPTLVVHGDDDQIVPIVPSALRSARLIKRSTLKVYEGAPHGLPVTHADRFNADLLTFLEG